MLMSSEKFGMQIVDALNSVIVKNEMPRKGSEVTGWAAAGGWKNGCVQKTLEIMMLLTSCPRLGTLLTDSYTPGLEAQ